MHPGLYDGLIANRENCEDAAKLLDYSAHEMREAFEGQRAYNLTTLLKIARGSSRLLLTNAENCVAFAERFGGEREGYEKALLGEPLKRSDGLYKQCQKLARAEARHGLSFSADLYVQAVARKQRWGRYKEKTARNTEGTPISCEEGCAH